MKKSARALSFFAALLLTSAATVSADILPLKEVKKGMKGYGLTVFEGTRTERFEVEIMGVLSNIGPQQDLILAKVDSEVIRRSGVIAGMSGSPVMIDGKVIGALAYAWPFAREGVAGITPIEEMLRIERSGRVSGKGAASPKFTASQFLNVLASRVTGESAEKVLASLLPARVSTAAGATPIAIPVSFSRFSSDTLSRFAPLLEGAGFMSVPSGSSGTKTAVDKLTFSPGDAIAGVLIEGDLSVAATGTVTYVDGDRVYAFGHPFLDIGPVSFPMAKSEIVGVLPSLSRSFKFSNTGAVVGALQEDRYAGIMGRMGARSDLIPVEMDLSTGGEPQRYRFRVVRHPQLSPLMLAIAADSVVSNAQRSAGERTVRIDSEISIAGFPPVRLQEGWAGSQARQAIPAYLAMVSGYLMSNEFHDASIEKITVKVRHDDELKIARLVEAAIEVPKDGEVQPGDTIRVRTVLKPFRGEAFTETFDVDIPDRLQPGTVHLMVGSGTLMNQLEFALVPPDPRTLPQLVDVLRRLHPSTELAVSLYSPTDGTVTAGVYLPELPPSMSALVSGDSSNALQAPVRYRATQRVDRQMDYVVDGSIKLDLQIKPVR